MPTDTIAPHAQEFALPIGYALGAVFFSAITGALAAIKRGYDIIGVFAMAFVTGLGGALIRDGIFIQDGPPALTRDWRYLGAIVAGCIGGWLVGIFIERFQKIIAVIDAAGLAAFSVVGVQLSQKAGLGVLASILVGTINACGGGLLRDVIVRDEPLMMKPGQFYVFVSALGSALFAFLTLKTSLTVIESGNIAIAVTFLLRILSIQFNWRTSAVQSWPQPLVELGEFTRELIRPVPPAPILPPTPHPVEPPHDETLPLSSRQSPAPPAHQSSQPSVPPPSAPPPAA